MTESEPGVVRASFEINPSECFRISLRLARWRFLAGGLVVLLLTSSFVYFFVLIGEWKLLLQLSPLFIGVPLISLGGPILRLHANSRKYVEALTPSKRKIQLTFAPNGDKYEVVQSESVSQISWNDIMKVTEQPQRFLLYQNKFEIAYIPKKAFHANDIATFRNIVRTRLGERAKLTTEQD